MAKRYLAVACSVGLLGWLAAVALAQEASTTVVAVASKGSGPIRDLESFETAKPQSFAMLPQAVTTPLHLMSSVTSMRIRAARNEDHIGFLLEWRDPSADVRTGIDRFGDMVAVAFPVEAGPPPSPFMGQRGGRIQILQWRADWQTDMEKGVLTVKELYPHAYPADFHHEDHLPPEAAKPYGGARSLGNPMSAPERKSSVQDLVAEGFGSLTPRARQSGSGIGRRTGETWQVIISRPLARDEESSASLAAGTNTHIAIAVWDGGKGEVGARKSWFGWAQLEVSQ